MRRPLPILEGETLDDLILGGLQMIQPQKGYRFSLDAVLLAHFVVLERTQTIVDLGTGNGILPLLLSNRTADGRIIGIEYQEAMVKRAERNVQLNQKNTQIEIIHGDIRQIEKFLPGGAAQLVLSNPPFWRQGEGKISQNQEEAIARHELQVNLQQVVEKATYLLGNGGRFAIIHRADRLQEVMKSFTDCKLRLKRLRMIHPFADREAKLMLLEGQKNGQGPLRILPPLIIYEQVGQYCNEIRKLYQLE